MRHFAEPFHGTILHYAEPFHATLHHLCVRCTIRHHADPCHETLHCKFCTVCNSSLFFLVVIAHTDEQYNNLLSTRESIIMINEQIFYAINSTKATNTFRSYLSYMFVAREITVYCNSQVFSRFR